jgi:hypothetical protein
MSEYLTVIDKLKKVGAWSLVRDLDPLLFNERVDLIRKVLLFAAEHHHDGGVLANWEMLSFAIADVHFLPLTKDKEYVHTEAWVKALQAVVISQATAASELHSLLPAFQEHREREDKSVKHPTLPNSKTALITTIAIGWEKAREETEADKFFATLVAYWEKTTFRTEKEMVEKALKEVTDHDFPPERLERQIRNLVFLSPNGVKVKAGMDSLARVLANGWNREADTGYTSQLVHLSSPLRHSSYGAWSWLAKQAQAIAAADIEIASLLENVRQICNIYNQEEATVHWNDLEHATITITKKASDCYSYGSDQENRYQKTGNKFFELAREQVLKWQEWHPGFKIQLVVEVPLGYLSSSEERLFHRSESF